MGVTDFLLLSWLGFAITAYAQDCARPAGGPNMNLKDEYILKDTFASGEQAGFACAVGYISAGGSSTITCTAGTWSDVKLKCERRNCGSPGELLNGEIHYPAENLFGDHIEITCNDGFRLVGKSTIVCGAQGWLDRLPRCEAMICDEAPQVKDATFTPHKDPYNFRDVVQYSCQNGLILNGSASISCSDDGTFKPAPPTCTRVQCEDLDLPNLDWVSGSRPPHKYKATITYRCRTGYKMVGPATLTCEINSKWSPRLPRCDKKENVPTKEPEKEKDPTKEPEIPPVGGDEGIPIGPIVGGIFGGVAGIVLICLGLICFGIVPSPVGKKDKRDQENCNRKEEKESLRDGMSMTQSPTDNGHVTGGTEDKTPVGSANV